MYSKKLLSVLLTIVLVLSVGALNLWADPWDPGKAVSLTVNKILTPVEPSVPGDGTALTLSGSPGVGVEFTLYKLTGVDANTTVANALTDYWDGVTTLTGTTDAAGQIVWNTAVDGLAQGYYLLVETASPYDGKYARAASAIITLPFANATGYLYDVNVYPKNVGGDYSKDVPGKAAVYQPGDTVVWVLESFINYQTVVSYVITDELDSRLTFGSVEVVMVDQSGAEQTLAPTYYTLDVTNNVVTIDLGNGLAEVANFEAVKILTKITTTINNSAFEVNGSDIIPNYANIAFNNGSGSQSVDIGPAWVSLANLELVKFGEQSAPLPGAVFKVCDAAGTVLTLNGQEFVLTTGSDGKVFVAGIPFTLVGSDYVVYLIETTAPSGYVLPHNPVFGPVKLERSTSLATFTVNQDTITYWAYNGGLEVTNTKGFNLPLTGGSGTIIFTVVGLVLILGAAFVLFRTRKVASK